MRPFQRGLDEALQEYDGSVESFAEIATFGERLRRLLSMDEGSRTGPLESLRRYDDFLGAYDGPAPDHLAEWATRVLSDLRGYSRTVSSLESGRPGADLLLELDDVVSVAVASVRAGVLAEDEMTRQARGIASELAALAPSMHVLWDYAEQREQELGPDLDHPEAYAFWEALAQLASDRAAISESLSMLGEEAVQKVVRDVVEGARRAGLIAETGDCAEEGPQNIVFLAQRRKNGIADAGLETFQSEEWCLAAAGVREDFPPVQRIEQVFDGEEVNLTFERDPDFDGLLIGLEGASGRTRSGVTLTVRYEDGEELTFEGTTISSGGCWKLPENGKRVVSVHLVFGDEGK